MPGPDTVSFPPFHLESSGQLRCGEEERFLRPKTLAVLHYLVQHAGQVVRKDELLAAVWPEVTVSEAVLAVCVNELRQALEDDPRQPRFIATVHRRGYRFIASLTATPPVSSSKFRVPSSPPLQVSSLQPQASIVVGREAELTQLQQWWELAQAGRRQVVFIAGEPGIGKTTLVDRFLARITSGHEHEFWIGWGQCVEQYGEGEAYLPILEALARLCRGPEGRQVREVLHRYAPTWLLQMPGLVEAAELNALQTRTTGATRERMLREIAEALETLTSERGLVLVCEDVHASDRSTLDLIAYIARRRGLARLMFLGTYRQAEVIVRAHPMKGIVQELQGHQQCHHLPVELLSERAVSEYLTVRFAPSPVPSAFITQVCARTEGNALFLVTLVDYLLRQGLLRQEHGEWQWPGSLQGIGVPESVRQLIERQIEHLSEDEQRVLEVASVAGIEFSAAAVSAGLEMELLRGEERCEAIARRTLFLQPSGMEEWPDGTGATRYRFRHALYQEVMYDRLTASRQRALHQRLGERLEAAYGQQTGKIAAALAVHFERGRDTNRTVLYLQQAGENALRRHAYQEALAHLQKGVEFLRTLPTTPERAQQELALQFLLIQTVVAVTGYASADTERAYTQARILCEQVGNTQQLFFVLLGLFRLRHGHCEYQHARALSAQCLALAQHEQDPALFFPAYYALGTSELYLGNFTAAEGYLTQGIRHHDTQYDTMYAALYGNATPYASCCGYAAMALWFLGYPDQALQHTHEMLRLAEEFAAPLTLAATRNFAPLVYHCCRQGADVQKHAEEGIAVATRMGFPFWRAIGTFWRGWSLAEQGQCDKGIQLMQQGLAAQQDTGSSVNRVHFSVLLAEACGKAGRIEEEGRLLADAQAEMDKTDERFYEAELYRLKGEFTLQQSSVRGVASSVRTNQKAKGKGQKAKFASPQPPIPNPQAEVEACFLKAIDIAHKQQAKSLELRATMSLARLWQQQGKFSEAHRMLADIYGWFTEGFDTKDLQDAKALLDSLGSSG